MRIGQRGFDSSHQIYRQWEGWEMELIVLVGNKLTADGVSYLHKEFQDVGNN